MTPLVRLGRRVNLSTTIASLSHSYDCIMKRVGLYLVQLVVIYLGSHWKYPSVC